MRISLLLILGLFIQTSIFAQTEQDQPATESIEQELEKQLKDITGIFGEGGMDTMLLKGLNLEELNLENLNLEDLMNGKMLDPNGLGGMMDMEAMMKMMEQSLQGMDLGNLEELLGPLMGGDLGQIFPQKEGQEDQENLENTPLGEDGKPVQKKKKKSTKKVYKL